MHTKKYVSIGKKPEEAKGVLVMIHGRGGSPDDILNLSTMLNIQDFAVVAPEATNNTWYPYSFLAPVHQNEPWLSSALSVLNTLVGELNEKGVDNKNIYFLGFSQGACLVLEFVTRHATRYGGVAALTG